MAEIPLENVGKIGIIVDQPPHDLPPEAWSAGNNVRFADGQVHKVSGIDKIYGALNTKSVESVGSVLLPSGTEDFDYPLRSSIDEEATVLAIGVPWKDTIDGTRSGLAYVYDVINGIPQNEQELSRSNGGAQESFGAIPAFSGDGQRLFVGARKYSNNKTTADARGAVYVYARNLESGLWEETHLISPNDLNNNAYFGWLVSSNYSGTRIAVSAPFNDPGAVSDAGSVYIFAYDANSDTWVQEQKLTLSAPIAGNMLGVGLTLAGDSSVLFASYREVNVNPEGRVAVYVPTIDSNNTYTWSTTPTQVLSASDAAASDFLGVAWGAGGTPTDNWPGYPIHTDKSGTILVAGAWGKDIILLQYLFADTSGDGDFTDVGTATHASASGSMRITGSDISNYVEIPFFVTRTTDTGEYTVSVDVIQGLTGNTMTVEYWDGSAWQALGSSASNTTLTGAITVTGEGEYQSKLRFYLAAGGGADYFDIDNLSVTVENGGCVYVFKDTGSKVFAEDQIIEPVLKNYTKKTYGWNIRLDPTGIILAVGASGIDITAIDEGGVYLYLSNGTSFSEQRFFQEPTPAKWRYWGYEVVLSNKGFTLVVNETADSVGATGPGIDGRARTHFYGIAEETIPTEPHYLLPWRVPGSPRWIFAGPTQVYYTDGSVNVNITRFTSILGDDDYTAGTRPVWSGGVLHGIPILNNNNGVDPPQQWDTGNSRLKNLVNWPANTFANIVRIYKQFIIALDITQSGVRDPFLVKWSNSALPGAVPTSWDDTDKTKNAGEESLSESQHTGGFLVDCRGLGASNIVYKSDGIIRMTLQTGVRTFAFDSVSQEEGLIAPNCVRGFFKQHFVVGYNDVYLFDGYKITPIIKNRYRRWLYKNIHPDHLDKTRVVPNFKTQEMLIGFVEAGSTSQFITKALIWNWDDDIWYVRDLPEIAYMENGLAVGQDLTYDELPGTFDDLDFEMGGDNITPAQTEILLARGYLENQLLRLGTGYTDKDGNPYTSFVERTGLALVGVDRQGAPKVDPTVRKITRRVYLKVSSEGNPIIFVSLGGQEHPKAAVQWEPAEPLQVNQDSFVDISVNTPYLAIRIADTQRDPWSLSGYILDLDLAGKVIT